MPAVSREGHLVSARDRLLGPAPGTRIKICCMSSLEEVELALEAGADALGLVSAMPSGAGIIGDDEAARIGRAIGDRAASVLLTSRQTAAALVQQLEAFVPAVLQMVDDITPADMAELRARFPALILMPVIHVRSEASVEEASAVSRLSDAILLDSGNPGAAVKELGGTGRVHDWTLSREICERVKQPVFLAGGLRPENVAKAIQQVRPHGVDVCSGVRRHGRLDRELLMRFVEAVRSTP